MAAWQATTAKAKFSEVLDKAETEGPQLVRRRKREFFILTKEEYDSLPKPANGLRKGKDHVPKKHQNLVEFFMNSPLRGSGIKIDRVKIKPRHVDF